MSFITTGDIVAVTVDSITLADGKVTLLVSDKDGVEYTMRIGRDLPGAQEAPQRPQEAPSAQEASPGLALAPEAAPAAAQGPSGPPQEAPEQADPAPAAATRPREYDDPETIALWLADHPEDLRGFSARLSHKKRIMIAGMLSELLGGSITNSDAIKSFSAVDPPPEFAGEGAMWGYEGSPLAAELHEGQINNILAKESTGHARVDERFKDAAVKSPKGNSLGAMAAASQFKDWSDAAMGK